MFNIIYINIFCLGKLTKLKMIDMIIEEFTRSKLITNTNYDFKKVPKLSETWFCCAEPSKIQLDRIKINKALI